MLGNPNWNPFKKQEAPKADEIAKARENLGLPVNTPDGLKHIDQETPRGENSFEKKG